jgi:hypothetical protein
MSALLITARIVPLATVRKQILDGTLTDEKLITALWFYDKPTMVEPVVKTCFESVYALFSGCFKSKPVILTSTEPTSQLHTNA